MIMNAGGFAGHTVNNRAQEYDFEEYGGVYEQRLSATMLKRLFYRIHDKPAKFYDYNF